MHNHVSHLGQDTRKLHRIQLRGELHQFGDEGIGEQVSDLVFA
jgi:hypothetical protein